MKEKTSITLSSELLTRIDRLTGARHSRSAFIEKVLSEYLRAQTRAAVDARDLALINAAAARLNSEAEEVLQHQETGFPVDSTE